MFVFTVLSIFLIFVSLALYGFKVRQWWILGVAGVVSAWCVLFGLVALLVMWLEGGRQRHDDPQTTHDGFIQGSDDRSTIEARLDDGTIAILPGVEADYSVSIVGDLADIVVEQRFFNPLDQQVEATYVFPLNDQAAVYAMEYVVGDETVVAKIKDRAEAIQIYETAKEAGKSAALLVQHRPNVFTQSIANFPPRSVVTVRLHYVHHAERRDGSYILHVPTKVGRRYVPDMSQNTLAGQVFESPVATAGASALRIHGVLTSTLPVRGVASATHGIEISGVDTRIDFATRGDVPNKDFELTWRIRQAQPVAAVTTTYDVATDTTYFSALVEPPSSVRPAATTPREVVFLLDCSRSMSGGPLEASRGFMHQALDQLRPDDTFRVIRFSDVATEFSEEPLLANPKNVRRGHDYINSLESQGGTVMTSGITQALTTAPGAGRLRIVVFLTDGYIGNDFEVIRLVDELRGESRIYAIGVGDSVNRFLLDEIADMGRGHAAYLPDGDGSVAEARSLALRITTPVLTEVSIDLRDANILDMYPKSLPDLFEGQSVRAVGRVAGKWNGQARVSGMAGDDRVDLVTITRTFDDPAQLVGRTWARSRIGTITHQLLKQDPSANASDLVEEAKQIGLGWSLVTQWTAFVAVSNKPVANLASTPFNNIEVHGTPEPGTMLCLLLAGTAALLSRRRGNDES